MSDIRSAITANALAGALAAPTATIGATPTAAQALAWLATHARNTKAHDRATGLEKLYADDTSTVISQREVTQVGSVVTAAEWANP